MSGLQQHDVVIMGGGIIGSSIAYWLAQESAFDGSVLVVERDPSYAGCSTSRSVGAYRQQFSTAENIEIGRFGRDFFHRAAELLRVDEPLDFSIVEPGYLFLATAAGTEVLEANHGRQREHRIDVALLAPDGIRARFPWMQVDDLAGGSLGTTEGWLDPHALMMAFRARAAASGVTFIDAEVGGLDLEGRRVVAVELTDGRRVGCGVAINAAGPRAAQVAAMAGIDDLPVHPRKRTVYTVHCREPIPDCPLVIDPTGVWFRPESDGHFLCGVSPPAERDPDTLDLEIDLGWFDEIVWPALARRVPAFDAIKRGNCWAGHYAVNTADHNAIVGPHPEVTGLLFANGFSGHGVQQSPAVARALAELITYGEYRSLDLSRFAFDRFARGELIHELNVI